MYFTVSPSLADQIKPSFKYIRKKEKKSQDKNGAVTQA